MDAELRRIEREEPDYFRRFRARVHAGWNVRRQRRPELVIVTTAEPQTLEDRERGNKPWFFTGIGTFVPGIGFRPGGHISPNGADEHERMTDYFACTPQLDYFWEDLLRPPGAKSLVRGYREFGRMGPHRPDWRVPEDAFPLRPVVVSRSESPRQVSYKWEPRT